LLHTTRLCDAMNDPAKKIALFGGTFDPPHLGHIEMARQAVRSFGLDEVRFLPCRISPHKPSQIPTSGALRMEMLRLATQGIDWAVPDDFELQAPAPSYSFARAHPGDRLFWLMGTDQWDALLRWEQPERLAPLVEFIVAWRNDRPPLPRAGYRLHPLPFAHPASASEIRSSAAAERLHRDWLHPAVAEFMETHALYRSCQARETPARDDHTPT
jgi:nicotinate-nucleotide adenylyltransferase